MSELYDMTFRELIISLREKNKGLGYEMWRNATLIGSLLAGEFPETPEKASPELYPPQPKYKMPDFLVEKAIKRGVM